MGNATTKEFKGGNLTAKERDRMQRRFQRLAKNGNTVSLADFQLLPELAGNPFLPRIFQVFDTDKDGLLTLQEFCAAIELFASLNTEQGKLQFMFKVYDLDGDGYVSAPETLQILKTVAGQALSPDQLQQLVENTIDLHDSDGDGRLSLDDFGALVSRIDADSMTVSLAA